MDVHLSSCSAVGLQPQNVKEHSWAQKEGPKIPPGNKLTSTFYTERKTTFISMRQQGDNTRLMFLLAAIHPNFWLFTLGTSSPESNVSQWLAGTALLFPADEGSGHTMSWATSLFDKGHSPCAEALLSPYPLWARTWGAFVQHKNHFTQLGWTAFSQTDRHA